MPERPPGIVVRLSGYKFRRVEALVEGRVSVEGYDTTFEKAAIGDMNTDVFSGPQSREVTEIGLHPFMLAYANDGFRPPPLTASWECSSGRGRCGPWRPAAMARWWLSCHRT